MGPKGDRYDNAVAELLRDAQEGARQPALMAHTTRADVQVFEYIEAFYNRARRHSTLGYLSPAELEKGTLGDDGASLAASRLASTDQEAK